MEKDNKNVRSSVSTISAFNSTTVLEEDVENACEYNPFDNRDMTHSNTTMGSFAHLLKSSLGSGILAMPMAYKNSGLLVGVLGTIIVGYICTHCVQAFVQTSQDICRKSKIPSLGFGETAEKAFESGASGARKYASFAKAVCDYGLVAMYLSGNCVYVVLIGKSFKQVIDYVEGVDWKIQYYIAVILIPLVILGEIRRLKYLVPLSVVANVCIVATFTITLYYIFIGGLTISDKPLFSSWDQLPIFFSTVVFAMEGIGVVMPVENQMKKPQHFLGFPGVLSVAMLTVVILYGVVGFLGYLRYGDLVKGSITLNLPIEEFGAQAAQILFGISILFTFELQYYVPMDILWRKIGPRISKKNHNIFQIVFRAVIILLMGVVAMIVPKLGAIINLVGAVFFSFLGLFVPAVVETVYRYPNDLGFAKWILIKNLIIIAFSMLTLITGSITSIKDILDPNVE